MTTVFTKILSHVRTLLEEEKLYFILFYNFVCSSPKTKINNVFQLKIIHLQYLLVDPVSLTKWDCPQPTRRWLHLIILTEDMKDDYMLLIHFFNQGRIEALKAGGVSDPLLSYNWNFHNYFNWVSKEGMSSIVNYSRFF